VSDPQPKKGYFPHELAEALASAMCNLTPSECGILMALLRMTYGWGRKSDKILYTKIVEITGSSRRMVIFGVQNLEAKKIVCVTRRRGRGNINQINTIELNEKYDEWVVQRKSEQYCKLLNDMKLRYKKQTEGVVQRNEGSAKNRQGVWGGVGGTQATSGKENPSPKKSLRIKKRTRGIVKDSSIQEPETPESNDPL